ncbi:hypothetical protein P4S63_07625 [Pseudoalteromonas sp. B193]
MVAFKVADKAFFMFGFSKTNETISIKKN